MTEKREERKAKRKEKAAEVKEKIKSAVEKRITKQTNPNAVTQNRLELLITVVSKSKAEYYRDLIQSFEV